MKLPVLLKGLNKEEKAELNKEQVIACPHCKST